MATARVIQDVVDDVSAYLGTITLINLALGLIVAGALWLIGMPYPADVGRASSRCSTTSPISGR